jgi:CRISPR-associated protein Csx10
VLVTATLEQPAALGRGAQADNRQLTFDHVPGSVLRGAYAAAWIRRHGPIADDQDFADIFEGVGAFGPLHCPQSLPLPLSIWRHKYPTQCTKKRWDRAFGENATECPECGIKLEQSKGTPMGAAALSRRLRSALDSEGTTIDQQLFEVSTLTAGTRLSGWVSGPAVRALRHGDQVVPRLKLGGGRSTHGGAIITIDPDATPDPVEVRGNGVILRLAAPGVFVDDFGLPSDQPGKTELGELGALLGCDKKDKEKVKITGKWTRWTEIGGWHLASGLPKPRERAVAAGSTYLVTCPAPPDPAGLAGLLTQGVGLRRREGFGALYRLPSDLPRSTAKEWLSVTVGLRGYPEWDTLRVKLRDRTRFWPPSPMTDHELRARSADLEAHQWEAFESLLSITDPTLYLEVLDLLERPS